MPPLRIAVDEPTEVVELIRRLPRTTRRYHYKSGAILVGERARQFVHPRSTDVMDGESPWEMQASVEWVETNLLTRVQRLRYTAMRLEFDRSHSRCTLQLQLRGQRLVIDLVTGDLRGHPRYEAWYQHCDSPGMPLVSPRPIMPTGHLVDVLPDASWVTMQTASVS